MANKNTKRIRKANHVKHGAPVDTNRPEGRNNWSPFIPKVLKEKRKQIIKQTKEVYG